MSKFKKLISSLLAAVFTVILLLPPNQTVRASSTLPAPAKIDARYTLKSGVLQLPEAVSHSYNKSLKSLPLPSNKSTFNPSVRQIYIDMANKTALRIKSINTDAAGNRTAVTETPELSEVLEEFHIPLQTVKPNSANVVILHKGVKFTPSFSPIAAADNKLYIAGETGDNVHRFDLTDFVLFESGDPKSDNYIKATVNGFIELKMPAITVAANMWSYKLDFSASELSKISLDIKGKLNKDIEVPIFAYPLDFGIGEASVGIFLHCKVNGEISIIVTVDQGVSLDAGIYGDSWFYIPYNVNSHFNSEHWFDVTPSIQGRIEASASVRAKANLKVLDSTIAGLYMDLGVMGKAAISNERVDLNIDAFLDIGGGVMGVDYTIYKHNWKIYESHEKHTAGFKIALKEANAYTNTITGTITKGPNNDPYTGNAILTIKHSNGSVDTINAPCTNGTFIYPNPRSALILLPLEKVFNLLPQDKVNAKVNTTEANVETGEVNATLPIDKIEIAYADAFNDLIKGTVSGEYSGPATIVVTTSSSPSIIVEKFIQVTCKNGEFSCSTPVTSGQRFSAYINFEGKRIVSPTAYPSLPFKINLSTDTTGTRGTIQNMHGFKRYLGKVTILYTDDDTKGKVIYKKTKMGEVNAVILNNQIPEPGANATSSNKRPNLTYSDIPVISTGITQLFGNSSQFTFNGVKKPAIYFIYEKHVYAVIEYEGLKQEQMYTIYPPAFPLPSNIVKPLWEFDINGF